MCVKGRAVIVSATTTQHCVLSTLATVAGWVRKTQLPGSHVISEKYNHILVRINGTYKYIIYATRYANSSHQHGQQLFPNIPSAVQGIKYHISVTFWLANADFLTSKCLLNYRHFQHQHFVLSCQMGMDVAADGVTTHTRECSNVTCSASYTEEYCKSASDTKVCPSILSTAYWLCWRII